MKKFLIIIGIFFIHTLTACASDISLVVPATVPIKESFTVSVDINTSSVPINSFDIKIAYPTDIVSFQGYREGNSIKKSWYLAPVDESGTIHFIGIIPGGVDGLYNPDKKELQPIPIIELLFSAKNNGQGVFVITHSEILKNDGIGTSLAHENHDASITVLPASTAPGSIKEVAEDKKPPESFELQYIPASIFSKTPSMIIFSATDADSGIKKYQMRAGGNLWRDVSSPLPTQRSLLNRQVVIRAVDFSDNVREAEVEIPGLLSVTRLLILIIFFAICYFLFFVVKRKR